MTPGTEPSGRTLPLIAHSARQVAVEMHATHVRTSLVPLLLSDTPIDTGRTCLRCWLLRHASMCLQDQKTAAPFYCRIAKHFEQAQSLEEAERFYIKAGLARQVSQPHATISIWRSLTLLDFAPLSCRSFLIVGRSVGSKSLFPCQMHISCMFDGCMLLS